VAGIGFELRRLEAQGGLLAPIASVGHGAAIAAGPWLATVLSMIAIQAGTPAGSSLAEAYAFRGLVVYAFMISLVASAPVVYLSTRQVADDIYLGRFDTVASRFAAALVASAASCLAATALVLVGVLGISGPDLSAALAMTGLTGLLWPTLAFCGAVRHFEAITTGFLLGLATAVAGAIAAAHAGFGAPVRLLAYGAGIAVTVLWLVGAVLGTFPQRAPGLARPLASLARDARRFPALALGGLAGAVALWADKWTVWASAEGARLANGLPYSPVYDSAMFVAYLAIVPALALFIVAVETTLLDRLRDFLAAIGEHGTLDEIEARARRLEGDVYRALARILTVQGCLCAVAAILAPAFVDALGLRFSQVGVFRMGVIAGLFQVLFLASATLLVFLERHRTFLALQGLFLALQIGLTLLSVTLGPDHLGFGHLAACALSAVVAVVALDRALARLAFATFAAAALPRRLPPVPLTHPSKGRP
jgi:uncharacterized membrane protein